MAAKAGEPKRKGQDILETHPGSDQRLVHNGHISRGGGVQALGLYLLLVAVADSQGLSYYSDKMAAQFGIGFIVSRRAGNEEEGPARTD